MLSAFVPSLLWSTVLFFLQNSAALVKPVSLRGLVTTQSGAIWASGTQGKVLRSNDNGGSWRTCTQAPDAATLDFRGIYAWNAEHAIVMSAGAGPLSRLYETTDGCASWHLVFSNPDLNGFWDALTFSSTQPQQGILLGDPVQGRFTIFRTSNGGHTWARDDNPKLATHPLGESAFAASNSSLSILPNSDIVFGTGGLGGAHIFRFDAGLNTWTSIPLHVSHKTETAGIFSVHFRSATQGIAVGGDYKNPQARTGTAFITKDGGRTWISPAIPPLGYRSAVDWDSDTKTWVAAGPTGSDISLDDGQTWQILEQGNWNALSLPWGAGPKAYLGRLPLPRRKYLR